MNKILEKLMRNAGFAEPKMAGRAKELSRQLINEIKLIVINQENLSNVDRLQIIKAIDGVFKENE
jgi:hypothetical protein